MKARLILTLSISLFSIQALAADYRYKVPMPRPAPERVADPAVPHIASYQTAALHFSQNFDPFKTQTQTVQAQPQQPINVPPNQPVVVQTAPAIDTNPGLLSWVLTAIGGTGVGGLLVNMFRKPKAASVDPGPLIQNPEFHAVLERVLTKVVNSDEIRGVARTGIGFIPGVGGFANTIEEVANRAAKAALAARFGGQLDGNAGATNPTATAPASGLEQWKAELLGQIGGIVQQRIEAALQKRAAP